MAHESFEDEEVANLMNKAFICIKVDREERPDVDSVYMSVCQALTGSGGWPLTIIMTPDQKPFFAATYIPKESRFGRSGMMELIPRIQTAWNENHQKLVDSAEKITKFMQKAEEIEIGETITEDILEEAYNSISDSFDEIYGGFGQAPKFPIPHQLLFLLRYWKRSEDERVLGMVTKTLDKMRQGGIFDHVGFGFHRYSTDQKWLLPHFEKMLYDQALLALAYTEGYQVTKKELYKKTVEQIFTYVLRDLTSNEGVFYAAEDADSEGEEGKFYVWDIKEVQSILNKEEAEFVRKKFQMQEEGNFKEEATRKKMGTNILHLIQPLSAEEEEIFEPIRQKLFAYRENRIRPGMDDKILIDWNGLMIAALSRGAGIFEDDQYTNAAKRAADFILESRKSKGKLMHQYCKGEWSIQGNLDDYTFFVFWIT